ncbi:MAG: hypothetical protein VX026_00720, partial [Myxococcota bacterium]|nr:hypothetical protein [Myxococcota bacterium]
STALKAIASAGGEVNLSEASGLNLTISDYTVLRIRDINTGFDGAADGSVVNAESVVAKGLVGEVSSAGLWITGGKRLKRSGLKFEAAHIDDAARARIVAAKGQCVIL